MDSAGKIVQTFEIFVTEVLPFIWLFVVTPVITWIFYNRQEKLDHKFARRLATASRTFVSDTGSFSAEVKKLSITLKMTKGWQFWLTWLIYVAVIAFIDSLFMADIESFKQVGNIVIFTVLNTIVLALLIWMLGYRAVIQNGTLRVSAPFYKTRVIALKHILTLDMERFGERNRHVKYDLRLAYPFLAFRKNIIVHTWDSSCAVLTCFAGNRLEFTESLIEAVREVNPEINVSLELP